MNGSNFIAMFEEANPGGFAEDGVWTLNSDKNVEPIEFAVNLYNRSFTNPTPSPRPVMIFRICWRREAGNGDRA